MQKEKVILQAALYLLVKNGFEGTPTSKIAAQAGVSNGTLFHYYKTKEQLIIALYNEVKAEMASYLSTQMSEQDNLEAKLKKTFIHSLYWALDNQEKFYYIQQFHFSPYLAKISTQVVEQQSRLHLQLIGEGIQAKVLKPLPVNLLFTLVSSQVYGLYQYLLTTDSVTQQQSLIEGGFDLLWQMIKA